MVGMGYQEMHVTWNNNRDGDHVKRRLTRVVATFVMVGVIWSKQGDASPNNLIRSHSHRHRSYIVGSVGKGEIHVALRKMGYKGRV